MARGLLNPNFISISIGKSISFSLIKVGWWRGEWCIYLSPWKTPSPILIIFNLFDLICLCEPFHSKAIYIWHILKSTGCFYYCTDKGRLTWIHLAFEFIWSLSFNNNITTQMLDYDLASHRGLPLLILVFKTFCVKKKKENTHIHTQYFPNGFHVT